jgi:hypothetical protein
LSRERFRAELAVDDATWERGRGWVLSTAVGALAYYEDSNPFMADQARQKLRSLLGNDAVFPDRPAECGAWPHADLRRVKTAPKRRLGGHSDVPICLVHVIAVDVVRARHSVLV